MSTVDSAGDVGYSSSLALSSNDNPCISYWDYTNGDLKYASWTGSSWTISTVDSTSQVGHYSSLALDYGDNAYISYYDETSDDLKFAKWMGSSWAISTVDSAGVVGWYTSLALDADGNPRISYYDYTNGDLKLASGVCRTDTAFLVVQGSDNGIYFKSYNTSSEVWGTWGLLPGLTVDAPAATVCGDELHVVVRGGDGSSLWHGYVNLFSSEFSGWSALAGSSPSTPTLASNNTHVVVVVRGGNDLIYYKLYSVASRSWGGWQIVPSGSTGDSLAAALFRNELHIVVRGMSGDLLWYCSGNLDSDSWSGWSALAGTSPSPPTLAGNSTHLALVVRGSNNLIYYKLFDLSSRSWGSWLIVPNGSTGDRVAAAFAGGLLQVVVRGESGGVPWHGSMSLDSATFSGWSALAGSTPSPPTLTS